jgi:hypothetical protein
MYLSKMPVRQRNRGGLGALAGTSTSASSSNPAQLLANPATNPKKNGLVAPNPWPVGSPWWQIYNAWDGLPDSALGPLVFSDGQVVTGWRAICFSTTDYNMGAQFELRVPAGSPVPPVHGPYMIGQIQNQAQTEEFFPNLINTNGVFSTTGQLVHEVTSGKNQNAFGDIITGIILAGAGAVVGAAIAGGSAVAVTGAAPTVDPVIPTVPDVDDIPDVDVPDVPATVPTTEPVVPTVPDVPDADVPETPPATVPTTPDVIPATPDVPDIPTGTAGTPMDLPPEFQPTSTLPSIGDSVTALTPEDIAAAATPDATIDSLLSDAADAFDASTISAAVPTASSMLPSAGQVASAVGTIAKIIGGSSAASGGAGSGAGGTGSGAGATSDDNQNLIGQTSSGSMGVLIFAGVAALILLGK